MTGQHEGSWAHGSEREERVRVTGQHQCSWAHGYEREERVSVVIAANVFASAEAPYPHYKAGLADLYSVPDSRTLFPQKKNLSDEYSSIIELNCQII